MSLSSRSGLHEKYGVTMEQACVMSMESSVLDTYLLEIPFKKLKLNLKFRVGENSPTMGIFQATVDAEQAMTIRAMIDSVLETSQIISLAFDEDRWRGFKYEYEFPSLAKPESHDVYRRNAGRGRWYPHDDHARKRCQMRPVQFALPRVKPFQIISSLRGAKAAGREAVWGRETYAKPSAVLSDLQAFAGPGSKVYVSLSQQPTFLLHDIVIPSPKDWAEIEATSNGL
jgi:hypothetical protein